MDDATSERIRVKALKAQEHLAAVLNKEMEDFDCVHGGQILSWLYRWLLHDELGRDPTPEEFDALLAHQLGQRDRQRREFGDES